MKMTVYSFDVKQQSFHVQIKNIEEIKNSKLPSRIQLSVIVFNITVQTKQTKDTNYC